MGHGQLRHQLLNISKLNTKVSSYQAD